MTIILTLAAIGGFLFSIASIREVDKRKHK